MRRIVVIGVLLAAVVVIGVAAAEGTPIKGSVGPSYTISVKDAAGSPVSHLDAGRYALTIDDLGDEHNFHLVGPGGIDVATSVEGTAVRTIELDLVDGKYEFMCDAHPLRMRGSFTVGTFTQPPAPPPTPKPQASKLTLTVTDRAVTLRNSAGAVARKLAAGAFSIKVVDRSKKQNAHLLGAGVNRKTGIVFVGTLTWKVTLKPGVLTYRSDAAKPKLRARKATVS
jgi:hypothetical protein